MSRQVATTTPTAAELGIDVFDPRVYARGIPYEDFASLRRQSPVCWHDEPGVMGWPAGPGFWAVTRYEDVRHVSKNPDVFSSWLGATQLRDVEPADLPFWRTMLNDMDPPEHTRLRRIVSTAFTPKVVVEREPAIRRRARSLVDGIAGRGEFDFAEEIGATLPVMVIGEVMGVPEEDWPLLLRWTDRTIGYQDEELAGRGGAQPLANPRSRAALTDMFEYARRIGAYKRAHPGDDLLSILVHAEVDGERLTEEEFETFFFLFTIAGNDTTHFALPGGLQALLEHQREKERLLAHPELLPGAIEEMLRWAGPVIHFRRTASRDVELRGQRIRQGDKVVVFYPSANRDKEVFPRPDEVDITRAPNPHLSFGGGPHLCLGLGLARLQLRILFEEFLWRLPDVEMAGPVARMQSNFVNGIKHLPVRCTPVR